MEQVKKYIIANWKMNPQTETEAVSLTNYLVQNLQAIKLKPNLTIVLAPPFVWLEKLNTIQRQNPSLFVLGAQNVFWENQGAFTGEISPLMLKNVGCRYVLIGHSERKIYLQETAETINRKLLVSLKSGLLPVLFLNPKTGENFYHNLQIILKGVSDLEIEKIIFVCEPTEAISTQGGKTLSRNDILKKLSFIKQNLTKIFPNLKLENISMLYGGSVNAANILSYTVDIGLDGAVVGAKSLNAQEFLSIIRQFNKDA